MAATRYRCVACGNLTRFDVVLRRQTSAFWHYTVGGELEIEDEQVLAEDIEKVSCRWCGNGDKLEKITADAAAEIEGSFLGHQQNHAKP